jgi:G3E family GTPase
VVTVVDAKHAGQALDEHDEARRQVGFADRILLTKTDLVEDAGEVDELTKRLRAMNPRAHQAKVHMGNADIREILDIRGFNLNAALEVDPEFLTSDYHEHDDDVKSFVWKDARPLHMEKIETFLSLMVQNYGEDLLRYKGVLNIQGEPRRMIFQGVHMLMGGTPGKPWEPGETRESVMVFIGRKLPRRLFEEGLAYCVA